MGRNVLVPVIAEAVALAVCWAVVWFGGRLLGARGGGARADEAAGPDLGPPRPRPRLTDAMRRDRSALPDGPDQACLHVESLFAPGWCVRCRAEIRWHPPRSRPDGRPHLRPRRRSVEAASTAGGPFRRRPR